MQSENVLQKKKSLIKKDSQNVTEYVTLAVK